MFAYHLKLAVGGTAAEYVHRVCGGADDMTNPVRIQRKRAKGYRMQAQSHLLNGLPAIYVGRPTKWGNPWRPGDMSPILHEKAGLVLSQQACVDQYRVSVTHSEEALDQLVTLCGKNLACYCSLNQPCHASVLLELANQ